MPDRQPYIKWLTAKGTPVHGGTGAWPLPTQRPDGAWTPGESLSVAGEIVPCQNGLHFCRLDQAAQWCRAGTVPFLVQYRGPLVDHGDKVVAGTARLVRRLAWDDRLARHFACDCAERVMRATGWADARSWDAVRVARRYANGHATEAELDAAWAAARDAWAAAEGAAWAAGAAAWAAARDAAWAAVLGAARDAARVWQGQRLWHYFTGGQPDA